MVQIKGEGTWKLWNVVLLENYNNKMNDKFKKREVPIE